MKSIFSASLLTILLATIAPLGLNDRAYASVDDIKHLTTTKVDPEQLKKLLGYYQLTPADRAEYDEMFRTAAFLTPYQWAQVQLKAQSEGLDLFMSTVYPRTEEAPKQGYYGPLRVSADTQAKLPSLIIEELNGFIETPNGMLYSKFVPSNAATSPLVIGGGFPFNQTQFTTFNSYVSQIAPADFYDPICNGMSVLYDKVANGGATCRPHKAAGPVQLLTEELSIRYAQLYLSNYAVATMMPLSQIQDAIFRLTRLSYRGITLNDQTHAIAALTVARGYQQGQAIFAGLSYGGLIGARVGALYPGLFKALVLFSPGVENAAHVKKARDVNAWLENFSVHRRVLRNMVHDIAYSPRYDAYLPELLKDYNLAFRDSLQKKMLGELDMDLRSDLARVVDPVYVISGGRDVAIDPKVQVDAMRSVFSRALGKGVFVLIPNGGHALWGNPAQSAETAVLNVLYQIEQGEAGIFKDRGVYVWNEEQGTFAVLGYGLDGLAAADAFIDQLKAQASQK